MTRRVSAHQAHYLPAVEYFARIAAVDKFLFIDDVQFEKGEYQHRNRIAGGRWLTLSLLKEHYTTRLCDRRLSGGHGSGSGPEHARLIRDAYRREPGLPLLEPLLARLETLHGGEVLPDVSYDLLLLACRALDLDTSRIVRTGGLPINAGTIPSPSARLAAQVAFLGGKVYVAGRCGPEYMDPGPFSVNGLRLEVFRWQPCDYGSAPNLSIVDLLAKKGRDARKFLGEITFERWT